MAQLGYINVKDAPYFAKGDGVNDDTAEIQAAFDAAALAPAGTTVFIPAGTYMVGKTGTAVALNFTANYCKLTGGGTLKHIFNLAYDNSAILLISGDHNLVEWLRIDGNLSGGATTTTDGYRDTGMYNRTRNVYVSNIPKAEGGPSGGSLQPLGVAGSMERCFSDGAYEGLRVGGNFNALWHCVSLNYNVKGYNNNSESTWTYASGCHVESTTNAVSVCGYQTDPGNTKVNGWSTLRDCTAIAEHTTVGTNAACKFSWLKSIYLDGCQILHGSSYTNVNTFRLAGNVGRCRMKDTFLSRNVFYQAAMFPINPAEVRLERVQIGDGSHVPDRAMEAVRCNILVVADSTFRNFRLSGIDWEGADGSYSLIVGRNCDFIGNNIADPTYDISARLPGVVEHGCGQLNRTRKLGWYASHRLNTGSGGPAQFTREDTSEEVLGFTIGTAMNMLAGSAPPDGTHVMWAVGDIIMKTTPASGQYVGWVLTSQAPITWEEWGIIS